MLERIREFKERPRIEVQIFVEDYSRNVVCREAPSFDTHEEAEKFYDEVMDFKKREEVLKGLIDRSDMFDHLELFEYTEDGRKFKLRVRKHGEQ